MLKVAQSRLVALTILLLIIIGVGLLAIYRPPSTDKLTQAFILNNYDANEEPFAVCAKQPIVIKNIEHIMLAVCRSTPTEESVATKGQTDFYVLKRTGNNLEISAQLHDVESGSMGQASDVEVIKLGDSFFGFRVSNNWIGQGHQFENAAIFAPKNEQIKEVLFMTDYATNSGECEAPCEIYEIKRTLTIDSRHSSKIYPLLVKEESEKNNKLSKSTFTLNFSRDDWEYKANKNIKLRLDD